MKGILTLSTDPANGIGREASPINAGRGGARVEDDSLRLVFLEQVLDLLNLALTVSSIKPQL